MKYRIFVVDDDRHYSRLIAYRLEKNLNYKISTHNSGEDALAALGERPHVVLLDIMMPGIGGIETLKRLRDQSPDTLVIMVSAQGVVDTAVQAMKLGAYDYITKGQDDLIKLERLVQHATEKISLEHEVNTLRSELSQRYTITGLMGDSAAMQQVYRLIDKALRGDLTVSIVGESGTGKELVAKAIHFSGNRRRGSFVVVNCAAIPRELMESEFFGHEKGSFTGAHARKIGKFEQAHGGTIFLDEIGELDLDLQAKLLRALQNREIQRVGGNETISFDARVISATNRDVVQMIHAGTFREDLYYRLFQFPVPLPPLRERGSDILLLAEYFLRDYLSTHPEFKGKKLSVQAKETIMTYNWPGNVRELKSAIERAILISDHDAISSEDLMLGAQPIAPWAQRITLADVPDLPPPAPTQPSFAQPVTAVPAPAFNPASLFGEEARFESAFTQPPPDTQADGIVSLEDLKQQAIERAYRLCDGNVDRAAVELGIGRATMYRLLKKYGLMA